MTRLAPARRTVLYLIPVVAMIVLLAGAGFAALEPETVESYTARLTRPWARPFRAWSWC